MTIPRLTTLLVSLICASDVALASQVAPESGQVSSPTSKILESATEIDARLEKNRQEQEKLKEQRIQTEQEYTQAQSQISKLYAEEKLKIETFRQKLADTSKRWLTDHKIQMENYTKIEAKVRDISKSVESAAGTNRHIYRSKYSEVKDVWQNLIDEGFLKYQLIFHDQNLIQPPRVSEGVLKKLDPERIESLNKLLDKAEKEHEDSLLMQAETIESQIDDYFLVLGEVSEVRANILSNLETLELIEVSGREYLTDLYREIFAIPFRLISLLFSRYVVIKQDINSGFLGLLSLLRKFLVLLFILGTPFLSRRFSAWTTLRLDTYRSKLLSRSKSVNPFNLTLALWIQRLTPYTPWSIYLINLLLLQSYLDQSVYSDVNILIPFLVYYVTYRMFRLLVGDTIVFLRNFVKIEQQQVTRLIDWTSKVVGSFFLASFSIMHLTQFTVDQGLVFGHMQAMMRVLGILAGCYAVMSWNTFLVPLSKKVFEGFIGDFLADRCQGRLSLFFCLPTLILIVLKLILAASLDRLSEWELSKKFLAKIYRKKVESLGVTEVQPDAELPQEYRELFEAEMPADRFLVEANQNKYLQIRSEIDEWIKGNEEDQSVVIYGEKGIGKTTLLNRLKSDYTDLNVVSLEAPPKISTRESLAKFLTESLNIQSTDNLVRGMLSFNKQQEKKTLILLDNAHNLFVGKVGGFDALRALVDLVNLNTENVFWCVVFNEYSWSYLKGALGDFDYFRTEIHLTSWSDKSIRELVSKRHEESSYSLSFDRIILASRSASTDTDALAYAEEQFFRLLWEQSNGNPRVALFLWLNCLSPLLWKVLKVGLPELPKTQKLANLNDTSWFVLSSIANHENANRKEIAESLNIDIGSVNHVIKMAIEEKLLFKGPAGRYQLGFTYQYDLIKQLKAKNFIYGLK